MRKYKASYGKAARKYILSGKSPVLAVLKAREGGVIRISDDAVIVRSHSKNKDSGAYSRNGHNPSREGLVK